MALTIDYTNMMATAVASGLSDQEWSGAAAAFEAAHARFREVAASGVAGFVDVATDQKLLDQSLAYAAGADGKFDDVAVLGIGGSALGTIALRTALLKPSWNALPASARGGRPRLHVLDNVDPVTMAALLERLDLPRTLWIVISKSGGTAETMSQFLIVHAKYAAAGLPPAGNFVFVTDPKQGALRPLAQSLGVRALDIPPNVGGRFSVLTPVGILPAALAGIDVRALLEGAADMARRCETSDLSSNPAGVYAVAQWLSDTAHGKSIAVFMPYSDQLRDLADWFVQLWAESLGKVRRDGAFVGQTPLAALGATDQHSQVQLFMEGPEDKTVTFVSVKESGADLQMSGDFPDVTGVAYLAGHSLAELMSVELRATAGALARRSRPNLTIGIERVDAWHVGSVLMLLQLATAYAGQLYGVDAFDQPGVELGKQFAYAMLGRPGSEAAIKEWETLPKPDERWQL
ncbi:MAG TPA: glucose-6-phosphate isomerase [Gemmatimonadaceae bacterium]|nr:glucose-6-phosphate isomerase [Gemmatimonadaceae bacterium]